MPVHLTLIQISQVALTFLFKLLISCNSSGPCSSKWSIQTDDLQVFACVGVWTCSRVAICLLFVFELSSVNWVAINNRWFILLVSIRIFFNKHWAFFLDSIQLPGLSENWINIGVVCFVISIVNRGITWKTFFLLLSIIFLLSRSAFLVGPQNLCVLDKSLWLLQRIIGITFGIGWTTFDCFFLGWGVVSLCKTESMIVLWEFVSSDQSLGLGIVIRVTVRITTSVRLREVIDVSLRWITFKLHFLFETWFAQCLLNFDAILCFQLSFFLFCGFFFCFKQGS